MPEDTGTSQLINQLTNPPNPMEKFGQTLNFAAGLKQFQANQAGADAYRQSIDPTTGALDMGKFNALMAAGPGAYNLGAAMQQSGQGVEAQGRGTQADVQAKTAQLEAAGQFMYPLLQKAANPNTPVTPDEVQATLDQAHSMGVLTDQQYQRVSGQLAKLPPGANANGFVLGMNMGNRGAIGLITGNPSYLTTGPAAVPVNPAPFAAQPNAPPVQMGLTPQNVAELQKWLAEPYSWRDTSAKEHTGTKGDFYTSRNQNPYKLFGNNNIPAPGSEPPTGGPVSTVTTGREPVKPPSAGAQAPPPSSGGAAAPGVMGTLPATPPTLPPPAPAAAPVPAPAPAPASPPTAPSPAAPPSAAPPTDTTVAVPPEQIKVGRDAYQQDQDLQSTLGSRVGPLESALSVLRAHPNMQTVGQDEINQLTQVANAFGFNIGNLDSANAYQELSKYLEGYLRNLPGANRSDLAQGQAAAASPHIGQGRDAMQLLLAKAVGYERLRAAGYDYFNSQYPDATAASKDSAQYKTKTASWLAQQDPVAYSVDEMTVPELKSYLSGLTPAAKAKFQASRQNALDLYNWLHPPGMPPATTPAPATP